MTNQDNQSETKEQTPLNIYRVKRFDYEYDEFKSFICAAKDEKSAREMHPSGLLDWEPNHQGYMCWHNSGLPEWDHQWTNEIHELEIKCIGTFNGINEQVIMTEFYNG